MYIREELPDLIVCRFSLDKDTYYIDDKEICLRETHEGGYCEADAGNGTRHPHKGPCHLHDKSLHSPNIKTGNYSAVAKHQLRAHLERFEQTYFDDLYSELAVLRALLSRKIQRFEGKKADEDAIIRMVNAIQRLTESIHKINQDNTLTVMAAKYMLAKAAMIAAKYITDPIELKAFLHEWKRDVLQERETKLLDLDYVEAGRMMLADDPNMIIEGFARVGED